MVGWGVSNCLKDLGFGIVWGRGCQYFDDLVQISSLVPRSEMREKTTAAERRSIEVGVNRAG